MGPPFFTLILQCKIYVKGFGRSVFELPVSGRPEGVRGSGREGKTKNKKQRGPGPRMLTYVVQEGCNGRNGRHHTPSRPHQSAHERTGDGHLPHDIEPGQKLARWFGSPYNAWFVGKVDHINKRCAPLQCSPLCLSTYHCDIYIITVQAHQVRERLCHLQQ